MVIHNDTEHPAEISSKDKGLKRKNCITGETQVQNVNENYKLINFHEGNSITRGSFPERKVGKRKVKKCKKEDTFCSSTDSEENITHCSHEISAEDLNELKTVYKKCKDVMKKIESKYGHLLDLDIEPSCKRLKDNENSEENQKECQCTLNKKIVFDEDGNEVIIDDKPTTHICPNKLMWHQTHLTAPVENKSIQIEYSSNDTILSDNLQELASILQNPELETTYRNKVIDKVRSIKLENSNEIKFNKHSLIEKLKSDPDTILDFNGANLSVLLGYS